MRLAEEKKIVPVANNMDLSGTATNPCDSINMKNFHRATFICQFGALGGAACYCVPKSGATEGTESSDVPFRYAIGGAATGTAVAGSTASCDVLAAATNATAAVTFAHATYDNYMLVVEVEASDMDIANGEEWLTLTFPDTAGGLTGNVTVIAILEPRYTNARSATCLK